MATTQFVPFGAFTSRPYGSFAGKTVTRNVPVPLTQGLTFGAFTSRRYGLFEGKTPYVIEPGGAYYTSKGRKLYPQRNALAEQIQEEDEFLVVLLAQFAVAPHKISS